MFRTCGAISPAQRSCRPPSQSLPLSRDALLCTISRRVGAQRRRNAHGRGARAAGQAPCRVLRAARHCRNAFPDGDGQARSVCAHPLRPEAEHCLLSRNVLAGIGLEACIRQIGQHGPYAQASDLLVVGERYMQRLGCSWWDRPVASARCCGCGWPACRADGRALRRRSEFPGRPCTASPAWRLPAAVRQEAAAK